MILDPVTLSVIQNGLRQVASEMDLVHEKTSFSPVISEAFDRSNGIYNKDSGEIIAQGELGLPIFLGVMQSTTQSVIDRRKDLEEGDVVIVNDPYFGGTHLMDVKMVKPFFYRGKLWAYLANTGHWPDTGGMVPGGFSAKATEVEQEGLRLPCRHPAGQGQCPHAAPAHAAQFHAASIPFIFDPGQGMPMFGGDELKTFIRQARWLTLNDYEWGMLQQKTGLTVAEVASQVEALIVTMGSEGSIIHTAGRTLRIPSAKPKAVIDPTGCGDAYRAGLIHGLLRGLDWETIGRTASLMGAIKIESRGPQNHRFTRTEFDQRYRDNFG